MADFNQHRRSDTHCSRQVHMVHEGGPMGMSTVAQTGLPICMGMGRAWASMGNQLKMRELDRLFAGWHVHACGACGIGRVFLVQLCELTDGTRVRAWGDGDCSSRGHGKSVGRHGRVMERRRFSSRGHGKSVGRHGQVMGRRRFSSAGRVRLGRLRRLVRASVSPRSSLPSAQVDVA